MHRNAVGGTKRIADTSDSQASPRHTAEAVTAAPSRV
jgi:hypothetical protein